MEDIIEKLITAMYATAFGLLFASPISAMFGFLYITPWLFIGTISTLGIAAILLTIKLWFCD